jgi:hypothetical protein
MITNHKTVFLRLASILCAIVCALLLTVGTGCRQGNPLERQPVSGHVTCDGAPLKIGNIQFMPLDGAKVGGGAVITDGKYEIAALKGLPRGKYRVEIHSSKTPTGSSPKKSTEDLAPLPQGGPVFNVETIAPQFNVNSKLVAEVAADKSNRFDFDTTSIK